MALFCADVALVSVGMSCQGAIQLQLNQAWIADLLGSGARIKRTPFDWLICPPATAANLIAADRYCPAQVSDLQCRAGIPPRWPAVGDCYYWHDGDSIASTPDAFLGKLAHTSQTLRSVRHCPRRIFFVANTQDNLVDEVQSVVQIPYLFTDDAIAGLAAAVRRRFAAPLFVVSAPGRHTLSAPQNLARLLLMDVSPGICGSRSDWAAAFRAMLAATPIG